MNALRALAFAVALAGATAAASAQTYPNRPIELVVPFAPGGSTDTIARLVGQKLSERLGQPVIVNNRPGGGTIIGTQAAARAAADGHTLLVMTISHAINAAARKTLPYDPVKAFAPITELSTFPLMLLVHPSLPVHSVADLVALAKAKPGQLNYASSGSGTSPHLAAEMFKTMAGVDLVHIPFKGNAEASNALLGGHVLVHFGLVPPFLQHVRSGTLRALAVTTETRVSFLPELPTLAESGYPAYEINSWQGIMAPAGTPPEIVARLQAEIARILALPEIRERLIVEGAEPVGSTPAQFEARFLAEIAKWQGVIERSGARLD